MVLFGLNCREFLETSNSVFQQYNIDVYNIAARAIPEDYGRIKSIQVNDDFRDDLDWYFMSQGYCIEVNEYRMMEWYKDEILDVIPQGEEIILYIRDDEKEYYSFFVDLKKEFPDRFTLHLVLLHSNKIQYISSELLAGLPGNAYLDSVLFIRSDDFSNGDIKLGERADDEYPILMEYILELHTKKRRDWKNRKSDTVFIYNPHTDCFESFPVNKSICLKDYSGLQRKIRDYIPLFKEDNVLENMIPVKDEKKRCKELKDLRINYAKTYSIPYTSPKCSRARSKTLQALFYGTFDQCLFFFTPNFFTFRY